MKRLLQADYILFAILESLPSTAEDTDKVVFLKA